MATDMTLQHDSVNSGTAVLLNGATLSYSWKNIADARPTQGKNDINPAEYAGFENPRIIISGTIDVSDVNPNIMTQALLTDFAMADLSTTPITLTVQTGLGTSTRYLKGRPTAGYNVGGTMTDFIYVQIASFDISFGTPESNEGCIWNYTVEMIETT